MLWRPNLPPRPTACSPSRWSSCSVLSAVRFHSWIFPHLTRHVLPHFPVPFPSSILCRLGPNVGFTVAGFFHGISIQVAVDGAVVSSAGEPTRTSKPSPKTFPGKSLLPNRSPPTFPQKTSTQRFPPNFLLVPLPVRVPAQSFP